MKEAAAAIISLALAIGLAITLGSPNPDAKDGVAPERKSCSTDAQCIAMYGPIGYGAL